MYSIEEDPMSELIDYGIFPGDRVIAYDFLETPPWKKNGNHDSAHKIGTVIARYGLKVNESYTNGHDWIYRDLIDIEFDHRPSHNRISEGHFAYGVKKVKGV